MGNKFHAWWLNFKEDFRKLRVLVIMLLRERFNTSWLRDKKKLILKIVITVLSFVAVTAAIWAVMYMTVSLGLLALPPDKTLKTRVMVFIFTILFVILLISMTIGLTKNLYFSNDNKLLLTFPVKTNHTLLAKLIVYYLTQLRHSFTFLVPAFLAFGMINGYGFGYYPVVILGFVFIALFITVLAAILSIPCMFIANIVKRYLVIQVVTFVSIFAVALYLVFKVIMAIPADLNIIKNFGRYYYAIQNFLLDFEKYVFPVNYIADMLTGSLTHPLTGFITFAVMLGMVLVGFLVIWYGARPLFFYMATRQFENNSTKKLHAGHNTCNNPFISSVKKELLTTVRTPKQFFADFSWVFALPFAILLLNKLFAAMSTRMLGDYIALGTNILIMLLILLNSSASMASIFSKEGAAFSLFKSRPSTLYTVMYSKIFLNFLLSVASLVATVAVFRWVSGVSAGVAVGVFFIVLFLYMAHILWSVDLNILNPQHHRYHDGEHETTDTNELKSSLYAFLLSFIFFAAAIFLLYKEKPVAATLRDLAFLALGVLVLRLALNWARVKMMVKAEGAEQ